MSDHTLNELIATRNPHKAAKLEMWACELDAYFRMRLAAPGEREDSGEAQQFAWSLYRSGLLNFLPDEGDRRVLADAISLGCDIFLTMDYRTIWRFRDRIGRLGLAAMRPVELVERISPWVGLLT